MPLVLAGLGLIVLTGFASLFIRDRKLCLRTGAAGVIIGFVPAIAASIKILLGAPALRLQIPWHIPYGSFYTVLDNLSALFLISVSAVCALAAVYACGYMQTHKKHPGVSVFFFNLLAAGMAMVVMARNGVLFLVAWEVMSLASYFLVTLDDEHESVRQAGWVYLVATHIGTAFLLAFFILLGKSNGTMDFDNAGGLPSASSALFLLALAGFGTKAGIMPLHVWLPEAHPAAPSHVSAVMSGVMIKMGIYGILRTISIVDAREPWWGWLVIALGVITGILGILFALAQHDLKRMLAYSSVENIGIILIGLGLGLVGIASHSNTLVLFGFAGALLHVVNHSLIKSLLFMGAGSVLHATGTRSMDVLGGLAKRMPGTAIPFAIGAVAICGLPPLNGFIGEFLLYCGAFNAAMDDGIRLVVPAILAIAALAVIGGFALAAFTKIYGIVFLGEPRTSCVAKAHEAPFEMNVSMWILAGLCALVGVLSPAGLPAITRIIAEISPHATSAAAAASDPASLLWIILISFFALAVLVCGLAILRHRLLAGRTVTAAPTWDCGYIAPAPRMQYTSSSFSQPIVSMFKDILSSRFRSVRIQELFPKQADFESHTPDVSSEYLYRPIFKWVDMLIGRMRWVQYGMVQIYVLYIAVTLLILLVWKLR